MNEVPATTGDAGPTIPPGLYRHYKGQRYEVVATARHSETREAMVVYRALYGDQGLWVRPAAMFLETVQVNGQPQARFAPVAGEIIESKNSL